MTKMFSGFEVRIMCTPAQKNRLRLCQKKSLKSSPSYGPGMRYHRQ